MTDIVERLRKGITDGVGLRWTVTKEHLEAADEIERLRKERDELLEALERLLRWVEPIAGDNRDSKAEAEELASVEQARTIIAKAGRHERDK